MGGWILFRGGIKANFQCFEENTIDKGLYDQPDRYMSQLAAFVTKSLHRIQGSGYYISYLHSQSSMEHAQFRFPVSIPTSHAVKSRPFDAVQALSHKRNCIEDFARLCCGAGDTVNYHRITGPSSFRWTECHPTVTWHKEQENFFKDSQVPNLRRLVTNNQNFPAVRHAIMLSGVYRNTSNPPCESAVSIEHIPFSDTSTLELVERYKEELGGGVEAWSESLSAADTPQQSSRERSRQSLDMKAVLDMKVN
ncbi:hypothetical protein J6590_061656 [Homalodisca vitripennis]|nr:hypothetical protein J6590_061656 [Homalodisca vitripennis]